VHGGQAVPGIADDLLSGPRHALFATVNRDLSVLATMRSTLAVQRGMRLASSPSNRESIGVGDQIGAVHNRLKCAVIGIARRKHHA
jgi:hypothetical protein